MNHNPWEADLDIDEETGEVTLPPGYTGRSGSPYGMQRAARHGISQLDPRKQSALAPPTPQHPGSTPEPPPTPSPQPGAAESAGDRLVRAPFHQNGCPPCPPCPQRIRCEGDSMLGLVAGLGMLGGVLWYAGKMMTDVSEYSEEDLDEVLAQLPSGAPTLASQDEDEVVEGVVLAEDENEG